jgi:hypothetical protein
MDSLHDMRPVGRICAETGKLRDANSGNVRDNLTDGDT